MNKIKFTEPFNSEIWEELLIFLSIWIKEGKDALTPAIIAEKFNMSVYAARAYLMALQGREDIFPSILVKRREEALKSNLKQSKKDIANLKKHLFLQEAIMDYHAAIEMSMADISNIPSLKQSTKAPFGECVALAITGDQHVDERVDLDKTNGLNMYNPDIAKKRMDRFYKRLLYRINIERKAGISIKVLYLVFAGDAISGYIHEELEENNYMTPVEGGLFFQELTVAGLKYLAENGEFTKIVVIMHVGNHSRTTKKLRFASNVKNSHEFWIYSNLKKTFEEYMTGYNNLEIIIPPSQFQYFSIYNLTFRSSHMNHFNYMGGVGGLEIPMARHYLQSQKVKPFDVMLGGHWHTKITSQSALVTASLIGYNSFAMGKQLKFAPPSQLLQFISKRHGLESNTAIYVHDDDDFKPSLR